MGPMGRVRKMPRSPLLAEPAKVPHEIAAAARQIEYKALEDIQQILGGLSTAARGRVLGLALSYHQEALQASR